jgi:predicted metalloprotease with PDZ domain
VFLLIPGARGEEHALALAPPSGWRVATPLEPRPAARGDARGLRRFVARDYDELVDAPIEVGGFRLIEASGGVTLAWHDAARRAPPARLGEHAAAIARQHLRWLGPAPYRRYLFVVHTHEGNDYQALEHASGSSLVVPRSVLDEREDYVDLLYVMAHEHLHVWNGKLLRPAEHARYDYLAPQPTRLLWWSEGVTDYLARRTLLAAGLLGAQSYLAALAHEVGRVQRSPERMWKSLADLGQDAFWPSRDPSEQALSYYAKGHLVALLLDLELRARSGGRAGLEQVLAGLAARARSGPPPLALTRSYLEARLRAAAGDQIGSLLARWVDRAGELDYARTLARLGLELRRKPRAAAPDPGFAARLRGGELEVTAVVRGGAAARAGFVVGDLVLAIDGRRPHAAWRSLLDRGEHELSTTRHGASRARALRVPLVRGDGYALERLSRVPAAVRALRERWLAP